MNLVPFKQYAAMEARKQGISLRGLYTAYYCGRVPKPKRVTINQRVIFVDLDATKGNYDQPRA